MDKKTELQWIYDYIKKNKVFDTDYYLSLSGYRMVLYRSFITTYIYHYSLFFADNNELYVMLSELYDYIRLLHKTDFNYTEFENFILGE